MKVNVILIWTKNLLNFMLVKLWPIKKSFKFPCPPVVIKGRNTWILPYCYSINGKKNNLHWQSQSEPISRQSFVNYLLCQSHNHVLSIIFVISRSNQQRRLYCINWRGNIKRNCISCQIWKIILVVNYEGIILVVNYEGIILIVN